MRRLTRALLGLGACNVLAAFLYIAPLAAQDTQADSLLIITQTQAAPPVQVEVSHSEADTTVVEVLIGPACGGCDVDAQAMVGGIGWFDRVQSDWPYMLLAGFGLWQVKRLVDKWEPAQTIINTMVEDGDVTQNGGDVNITPGGEDDCLPDGPYPE